MTSLLVRRARGLGWDMRIEELRRGSSTYVLVHGYGVTSRYLHPTAALLAAAGRVLMPTLPGWRGSARPRRALDVPELADVLADWMRSESLPPAVVVGNSFGCQVVAELCVRSPELVRGGVLTGPTVEPAARTFPRMIGRLVIDTAREPWRLGRIIAVDYTAFGPRRSIRMGRVALSHELEHVLPRVDVPLLVVRGTRDGMLTRAWAQRCAALAPHATFAEIDGVAHAVNYNAPADLVRLIHDFETQLGTPSPGVPVRQS